MKIPGYRFLVDVTFVELRERIPELFKSVNFTGFDFRTGLYIHNIDKEYFYIKDSADGKPVAYTYEEMLKDVNLRKILNYLLVWVNQIKYDGLAIATTGRPDLFFVVDTEGECNILRKYGAEYIGTKGVKIEPVLLSTMPLITKTQEFIHID